MKNKKELKKLAKTIASMELELQKQEDANTLAEIEKLIKNLSFEDCIELDEMITTILEKNSQN